MAAWSNKLIFFLLCLTIVWTTLAYGTVHQPVIALFYLVIALVIILWSATALFGGGLRYSTSWLQIPLIAVVLYALVQLIPFGATETAGVGDIARTISLDPFWTRVYALHYFALLVFFAALLAFTDSLERVKKLVWLITIFGFVFGFYAILQYVLSPTKIYGIYEVTYAQPFGSFVNRHNFAAFMEMAIAVPLGMMFAGAIPRDRRLLVMTGIGVMGVALILSGSRGGLVALLGEIFFLIIITTKTKSYGQFILKIALSVGLIATIVVGSILVGGESSLTRLAETAASEDISSSRWHIWDVTLQVIRHHLPFGAGIGAFRAAYTQFDNLSGFERVEQAHNDYLQILADAGIVGLIIAAFFVFWLFRTGFRNIKMRDKFRRGAAVGALAGCAAIMIHSVFDFVLHTTAITLMFLTVASLVVTSRAGEDEAEIDLPDDQPNENVASLTERKRRRRRSRSDKVKELKIEN